MVAENYDEVVFTNPIESMYIQLLRIQNLPPILTYSQQKHFAEYSDYEHVAVLLEAQKFLQQELATTKERLLAVDQDLQTVDEALRDVQDAKNRKSAPGRPRNSGPPAKKAKS